MSVILTYSGQSKTAAAWDITGVKLVLRSGAADALTFSHHRRIPSAEPIFTPGERIELWIDEVRRFSGVVQEPVDSVTNGVFIDSFTALGPWQDLDEIVAQQIWTKIDTDGGTEQSANQCHILFGVENDGTAVRTGAMLGKLIDNAISRGVQISKGTLFTGIYAPTWEASDITIAGAINAVLKWHPSAVAWWDYTTATPTLNITLGSDLTEAAIDATDPEVTSVQLRNRPDLQVPACAIIYERRQAYQEVTAKRGDGTIVKTTSTNAAYYGWEIIATGVTRYWEYLTTDIYPSRTDLADPGVLTHSIAWGNTFSPALGVAQAIVNESSALFSTGTVEMQTLPASLSSETWMGRRLAVSSTRAKGLCPVRGVTYNLDAGTTTLDIGPGGYLTVQDWIEYLNRGRKSSSSDSNSSITSAASGSGTEGGSGLPEGYTETHIRALDEDTITQRFILTRTVAAGEE